MSEADSKKEPLQPPASEPTPAVEPAKSSKTAPSKPVASGGAKSLATVALLVGLGGVALAGYGVWQLQQLGAQEGQRLEAMQGTAEQTRQLAERERQMAARLDRLEQLPSASELEERRRMLATLQSDQQRLSGRVEQVLGASREEWRLAEAEHLLRMAMLQLSAMQDVKSAEMLVHEADLILQKQDDPAAYSTRQKLLEGLEGLRSLPELDRTGLFLQLGALRGQTAQLSALAPEFVNGEAQPESAQDSRWQRWLNELTRYVRVDFDASADVKPLLAGQTLGQVRLALSLAIEQAQWAVLNGNAEVYRQSLEQASSVLKDHFSEDNGQARGLRKRLEELSQREVEVTLPDLAPALEALQAYVQKRERRDAGDTGEAPAQPETQDAEQEAQRT
ncbi:Putative uroporphyrinogen-III C-methyltransferase [Stutzerimonas frequens]|uniref:uroporphyrinogen-III C-methyltransferase n=1 Tax=Stutzerimonas frequens TaxID=2968969 RepID=UPI0007BAB2CB|nr:uroporphyrinogen-III C-methyltransferase [Stutzerimonas frequens]KZX65275.1 heme biosynthesis operon protein HemX [Stutzerimonas frequens]MAL90710.1 heme biosynthesis operon protein HemX [Pseudomonas sp.]NCT78540.1 heme biosynthesis operon protein HemX [Stutzerimonas stutzeri]QFU10885.1 Putative uroporphyrinogen-III C-methyltransferase [Stutzerimonas frequens]